jgi:hypothetical protein
VAMVRTRRGVGNKPKSEDRAGGARGVRPGGMGGLGVNYEGEWVVGC